VNSYHDGVPTNSGRQIDMTLLGMYDLERFNIYVGAHKDAQTQQITRRHEYVHYFLTIKSTYGQLLQEAKAIADESNESCDKELLKVLVSRCRNVQESAATFDSLNQLGRTDMLRILPDYYIEQYRRMAAIVSRHFSGPLAQSALSFAVARCAMLSTVKNLGDYQERYAENPAPGHVVPKDEAPDDRFLIIEKLMNNVDPDMLRKGLSRGYLPKEMADAFLAANNPSEFMAEQQHVIIAETATDSFCRTLCQAFDDTLPGLEDARATNSARSGLRALPFITQSRTQESGENTIFQLRETAQERVLGSNAPAPGIHVSKGMREFEDVMASTIGRLDAVFAYIACRDRKPVMYHVDLSVEGRTRNGKILFNELDSDALSRMSPNHPKRITLTEFDTWVSLSGIPAAPCINGALRNDCLVFVNENPIDFMMKMERASTIIRLWPFQFEYKTGVIRREHNLGVMIYLLDKHPMPFFHLASPVVLAAIEKSGSRQGYLAC
jgi:hypothetical protein